MRDEVVKWNGKGDCCQGDLIMFAVPRAVAKLLSRKNEIGPTQHGLVLLEGEESGHHHVIRHMRPAMFRDTGSNYAGGLGGGATSEALAATLAKETVGVAKLYSDTDLIQRLVQAGELTRADLAVGLLEVKDAPVRITHEDHTTIEVPQGVYYVGRQIESVGAEERAVRD